MRRNFLLCFICYIMMFCISSCNETKVCVHTDANDDGKCDACGTDYSDGSDNPLDGKKIIFIGNSYTYYGQTVFEKSQTKLTQASRTGDKSYFYQLCRANGAEVEVTNWTFGGHNLENLFGGSCTANRGCDGEDHKAYLTDRYFDYVVVQPGSSATSSASFLSDMEVVTSFFREANPNVKFVVLVPYSAYGTIGSTPTLAKEFLDGLKTVADDGGIIVDWGGVVMNILNGVTQVPDTSLEYVKNTFVIAKSAKDGYHPNQLSGYITTLMTYCAITGENAVGQPYAFCNDGSLRPTGVSSKFFDFDKYIETYYTYNGATTNYPEVFASEEDMQGLQGLIDAHLAAKAYMNYDYCGSDDEVTDDDSDAMSDSDAVAAGYAAKLLNSGTESYLTLDELQTKIKSGYTDGDFITLLTDVTCVGATSSNMSKSKTVSVTFDLNAKTLTLSRGSVMRTTYSNGYKSTFNLISSNGMGTLTLASGNTYTAFQAYGSDKVITVGTDYGYTDGDAVTINAARLMYISDFYDNTGDTSSFTFYGGCYNQTGISDGAIGFIGTCGKYNEGYTTNYFEGSVRFIGATITQTVESSYALFTTTLSDADQIPETAVTVPGIILENCVINGYSDNSVIHNMETLSSLITYNNCKIKGDISVIGTDTTDAGLGKVILGTGTTFNADDIGFVNTFDKTAVETYDGSSSGVYLAENTTLETDSSGHKVA